MSLLDVANQKPKKPSSVSEYNNTSHTELVQKAQSFLKKICYITCAEIKVQNQIESPDVIGFQTYKSIVIECKRTYADFRQDMYKPHRENPSFGMGDKRYYFCLSGVIPVNELPTNWGLIEWYAEQGKMIISKPSGIFYPDKVREHMLLITIIRRIGAHNQDKSFVMSGEYYNPANRNKPFEENDVIINIGLRDGL